MGCFSWCTSDTKKSIAIGMTGYDDCPKKVYLLNPFGEPYVEENYDGYGTFGGNDVYALLAKWNAPGLCEDEAGNWLPDDEIRDIGIEIGCYNVQQVKLKYPIKIVEKVVPYEEAKISPNCPGQGWWADEYADDIEQEIQDRNKMVEEAFQDLEQAVKEHIQVLVERRNSNINGIMFANDILRDISRNWETNRQAVLDYASEYVGRVTVKKDNPNIVGFNVGGLIGMLDADKKEIFFDIETLGLSAHTYQGTMKGVEKYFNQRIESFSAYPEIVNKYINEEPKDLGYINLQDAPPISMDDKIKWERLKKVFEAQIEVMEGLLYYIKTNMRSKNSDEIIDFLKKRDVAEIEFETNRFYRIKIGGLWGYVDATNGSSWYDAIGIGLNNTHYDELLFELKYSGPSKLQLIMNNSLKDKPLLEEWIKEGWHIVKF